MPFMSKCLTNRETKHCIPHCFQERTHSPFAPLVKWPISSTVTTSFYVENLTEVLIFVLFYYYFYIFWIAFFDYSFFHLVPLPPKPPYLNKWRKMIISEPTLMYFTRQVCEPRQQFWKISAKRRRINKK